MSAVHPRTNPVAAVAALQLATGAALVARPAAVWRRVAGPGDARRATDVVRLLGGRMAVQGAVELLRPAPRVAAAGAAVDGTHALSMLLLAAVSGRYRRAALASAGLAGGTAVLALATLRGRR